MKYFIKTMGCQMNVHDSEKIAGILSETGYQEAEESNEADIVVLNTCSIRKKAEQKFYSELGRLKKAKKYNPDLKIAVAGCIAQQEKETLFKRFPYVDFVFGPNNIDNLQNWINERAQITDNGIKRKSSIPYKNPSGEVGRAGQVPHLHVRMTGNRTM